MNYLPRMNVLSPFVPVWKAGLHIREDLKVSMRCVLIPARFILWPKLLAFLASKIKKSVIPVMTPTDMAIFGCSLLK